MRTKGTIGIHNRPGGFSDRWLAYCDEREIPYRVIDCLASDVVQQSRGLTAVLWHWSHDDPRSQLVARQIIASLEATGVVVFPSAKTCWHFDDKVAQKYLLEAIDAPVISTWVFTDKMKALAWVDTASWPKVFKLRCGAGSGNVRMVRSAREAVALCDQAFGRGFPPSGGYFTDLPTRVRKGRVSGEFWRRVRRAPRTIRHRMALRRRMHREKGYVYFQEFLPDNPFDTRVTVIGDRAFAFRRANRPDDFRASGSGSLDYDPTVIDQRCISTAFRVADRIRSQSLAFDFLFDGSRQPVICEISYCYMAAAVYRCPGHWRRDGSWQAGQVWPQDAILEDLLAQLSASIPESRSVCAAKRLS